MVGQTFEALTSGLLDLRVGIVREHEEDGRELDRFEGQGAPCSHPAGFDGRVPAGVSSPPGA